MGASVGFALLRGTPCCCSCTRTGRHLFLHAVHALYYMWWSRSILNPNSSIRWEQQPAKAMQTTKSEAIRCVVVA